MSQNCYGLEASSTGKKRSRSMMRISRVAYVLYEVLYMAWCGYDEEGNFVDFLHRREVLDLKRTGFENINPWLTAL